MQGRTFNAPGFGFGFGAGPGFGRWAAMAGRGRGHGPGPGPGGRYGRGGPGWGGRRRRMRRGDVRAALLVLLEEQPYNGYGLMQEIERRSDGAWRPSPGSVYPALQQLEDEGLVRAEEEPARRLFSLTDAGRAYVNEHREALGEPWADLADDVGEGRLALRGLVGQVAAAVMQVGAAGDDAQVARATELLVETRRRLYRILAEEDQPSAAPDPAAEPPDASVAPEAAAAPEAPGSTDPQG